MNNMNNESKPDSASLEYREKRKRMEEFQARLSKMFADTGIIEVKNLDDDNDSPQTDTYTITVSNGVKDQSPETRD